MRREEGLEEGFESYFFGATGNNVANERFVFCRGALGDDASLRDGVVTAKRFFHFDRVNAEATNLHFIIPAAEELDSAVRAVERSVSTAIESRSCFGGEGMVDEASRREVRVLEVAESESVAS